MVVRYRSKFWKVFGLTMLLSILAAILMFRVIYLIGKNPDPEAAWILIAIGLLLAILANVFYFWSHYLLAKAKGYSGWLTLLGLINLFGLLILFILPDKRKHG